MSKATHNTQSQDADNVTNPEHSEHRIVTPMQYLVAYVVLLVLTLLMVGSAYLPMGLLSPMLVIGIACTKAVLVVLLLMHALFESRLIKITIGAGLFAFLVLFMMSMADYVSRAWGMW